MNRALCVALLAAFACARPAAFGEEDDNEPLNGRCGVERWAIKTGSDSAASTVNLTPRDTTIAALAALPAPATLTSSSARFPNSAETQAWRLTNVTLTEYKLESDSDYHLVVKDAAGQTMIVEIPDPACVSGGTWQTSIRAARAAMDAKFTVSGSFQAANVPVTVTGVGFFDLPHGQTGVAPNALELHAVLSICFVGSTCTATPDFSVAASPASVSGATAQAAVAVTGANGFTGQVAFSASGLPAGASAHFAPAAVSPGASTQLALTAGSAAPGTYPVTITGTSGSLTHTAQLSWNIPGGGSGGFAVAANPPSVNGAGAAAIAVTGSGSAVALSVSGVPAGATASFSPASVAPGSSAVLSLAPGSAAAGTYALTVSGSAAGVTQTAQLSWTIGATGSAGGQLVNGDFETGDLSGWTASGVVRATTTGAYAGVYVAELGSTNPSATSTLSQRVTLPSGSPQLSFRYRIVCPDTVQYDWATVSVSGSQTITALPRTCSDDGVWHSGGADLTALAGQTVTVTLTNHDDGYFGDETYTLYDDVQITGGGAAQDFSLSASPAAASGAASASIAVAGSGAVALGVSGVPAGASATLSNASVTAGGSSTLTLSPGSAQGGTYAVLVTGVSGGVTHTTAVSWTIAGSTSTDFALGVSPASATNAGNVSVSVTPSAGFTSPVALSVSGVPSGASASFSPASVTSGTSTLSLAPGTAPAGSYALTVTGTGGGHTHTAALSWSISSAAPPTIQTVFMILMENHNWSSIQGSSSAPYINGTLLPQASYALNYMNPPGIHPSEPNYLWLEAGTNFGVLNDNAPSSNHQSSTQHLVTLLQNAGISWKSYQEGITGTTCPLTSSGLYAPKHNPMVFFDDVTNSLNASSANCIAHVRPFSELAADLRNNTTARYNFLTPNLCDDMHNPTGCATTDEVANGDTWLSQNVPQILASAAFRNNGLLIITWDESENGDFPIGMIVLSPKAKGNGYTNTIAYTHSSTLRSMQEIFGVMPYLGDAANATDLRDLFTSFP